MRKIIAIVIVLLVSAIFFCATVTAEMSDDGIKERISAAYEYLGAFSIEQVVDNAVKQLAKDMSKERGAKFSKTVKENMRISVIERAMVDSLAKHFTVSELKALTKFYSTPEGQSVMQKLASFEADVAPVINAELNKAREALGAS